MMTKDLDDLPIWNPLFRLPLVTDDSELFEFQILLGGISLVLSRLHPQLAKNRFTYTRGLAMKLTRVLESGDPRQASPSSAHLSQAMAECERALDPGTLVTFKKMVLQTLAEEQRAPKPAIDDFTFSAFVNADKLTPKFATQAVLGSSTAS